MRERDHPLDTILPFVQKPARYLGGETGAAAAARPGDLRFVLAYADVYEIGMSHQGLLNLYRALAAEDGVAVERCFAPWPDMAAALREAAFPLAALESGLPLQEAALVGFSFASPLNFTTALLMLDLAGIPLWSRERGDDDPLIVGGGQAMFNPEPMAPFLDAVALGEGEGLVVEIARAVKEARAGGLGRAGTLARLATVEGVYVPAYYEPFYEDGDFAGMRVAAGAPPLPAPPPRIRKRTLASLDSLTGGAPLVANVEPTHDRVAVEVMRGCAWGCRFCQAGMVTRPPRERPVTAVYDDARARAAATGAEELSFLALNACDYSHLHEIVGALRANRPDLKLSLPAARITTYRETTAADLVWHRRSQQTFAPETGTDRLRRVANKDFNNDDVLSAVRAAGRAGCQNIKLYFMVGLPTETDDDAQAIGELAAACRQALKEGLGRWGNLGVAVSPFVPQAHTPFQWFGLAAAATIKRRLALVRANLPKNIKFEGDVGTRVLEACLARGDRRVADVVLAAYRAGAAFDPWRDQYRDAIWQQAFRDAGLDIAAYAERELDPDASLPWNHIDVGVSAEYLKAERRRALDATVSPPCSGGACRRCGVCSDAMSPTATPAARLVYPKLTGGPLSRKAVRIRFAYGKTGRWRWLSHLELSRLLRLQLTRAGLPLSFTEGFTPHPILKIGPALPVGVAAENEYADVWLREDVAAEEFLTRAQTAGPFAVAAAWKEAPEVEALEVAVKGGRYRLEFAPAAAAARITVAAAASTVAAKLALSSLEIDTRKGKADLGKTAFEVLCWDEEDLILTFNLAATAHVGVFELAAALLSVAAREARAARVTRLASLGLRVGGVPKP